MDLSDEITELGTLAQRQGYVRFQREHVRQGDQLIPTGNCRWLIMDKQGLKQWVVRVLGKERAIEIGQITSTAEEGLKFYRMVEVLNPHELGLLSDALKNVI